MISLASSHPLLLLLLIQHWNVQAVPPPQSCKIRLNNILGKYPCIAECLTRQHASEESFVCDVSAEWMHHVGGSHHWYPATPPQGTGVHEYVAFTGTPPCKENGHCPGCDQARVQGTRLCSVLIDPKDCSVQCPTQRETEEEF